ncbi:MAG TPA: hypothetical protein P5509_05370 [Bacteroidales bacterium]|nr:hypothetical protein [Bacteroidales bacterium]
MNPLLKLIDDTFVMQIYSAVLKRNDDVHIVRFYANYFLDHICLRKNNEEKGEKPLLVINSDLSLEFNEAEIDSKEQESVMKFLIGWGFKEASNKNANS